MDSTPRESKPIAPPIGAASDQAPSGNGAAKAKLVRILSGGGHVSGGFQGRLRSSEVGALQKQWVEFVATHRSELAAGRKFKTGDGSGFDALISPGWQFTLPNK